jgi:hypothetical protein
MVVLWVSWKSPIDVGSYHVLEAISISGPEQGNSQQRRFLSSVSPFWRGNA